MPYDHNQYVIVRGYRRGESSLNELEYDRREPHLRRHGPDPCYIFFARFVNEADILNMSEALAFIALPTFLEEPAER